MKAAWYERQCPPYEVLVVGEMTTPKPGPRDVRIRVAASGVNPGDVKKRQDTFGVGMPFPRVIPHSDGAGVIEEVGNKVSSSRIGERVWCFGAQSYRPFGTAAECVVVPNDQAIPLPDGIAFEQGACLGIPGITAHRAVHVAGSVRGQVVLVQGGAGTVGQCAASLARHAGALVISTVRSERDAATAQRAGAHHVIVTGGLLADEIVERIFAISPDGIDHIVVVLPEFQNQGVGKTIMNALLDKLPKTSIVLIFATPGKENFYRKFRFNSLKTGMGLFPNPEWFRANGYIE